MNEMSETVNADFWKNRRVWVVWIGIFIASLTWRLFLIGKYPIVYSFDAFIRIWDADELFVRHWLPLPHLPIMFAHAAGLGLKTLRYFFAFFSAASIVTIGIAISRIYRTHLLGVTGALLIGSLGNYIVWSVVPYQEGLMFTFLGLFLMFSPYVHDNLPDRFYWTAGIFLMMASLCRYEVWILTVIILIRFLYTRRFRIVLSLLPGLIIPVIWVVIYQFVDVHTGPPRSEHALEPINLATLSDPGTIVKLSSGVLVRAFSEMVEDLGWIGALILPVGILFSLRNSCRWGRELVIFWAALAGLVFVRGINSHGVLTMRMFVPLNVIAVILSTEFFYAAGGYLRHRSFILREFLPAMAVVAVCTAWLMRGYYLVGQYSYAYVHEAIAARLLESVPEGEKVIIETRPISNVWGEKSLGAIFAQSFGILDHRDRRWIYEWNRDAEQARYILAWNKDMNRYLLFRKSRGKVDIVQPSGGVND